MNLAKLFETQKVLRDRIAYKKSDLPEIMILALQVELGECCNEWRGFKIWSKNQEPRLEIECHACEGVGGFQHGQAEDFEEETCLYCQGTGIQSRPLLEEYVDGLHFVLEIGLCDYLTYREYVPVRKWNLDTSPIKYETIIKQFNKLFGTIGYLEDCMTDHEMGYDSEVEDQYENVVRLYLGLGEMLGFTWEQIEQAYFDKNAINHERQDNGY
jgi:dimeric dUTPase (all-alpha-NTP-PPase superfamily)